MAVPSDVISVAVDLRTLGNSVSVNNVLTNQVTIVGTTIISGPPGIGAGAGIWGTINGVLSNQTDLQAALNLKAPLASPSFTGTPAAPTAGPGTNTNQIATTAFVEGEITAAPNATFTVSGKVKQSVYNVRDYGAVTDGTTDDTTAINNAIADAVSNNGGTIFFPPGTTRINGAVHIPYTVVSGHPKQSPLRFTGVGPTWSGYFNVPPIAGSILDMRYDGLDSLHPAKIDTRGDGHLEIDHLTIQDAGSDNFLFIQTTNTRLHLHDVCFMGNPANDTTDCVQDAIKLGGKGTNIQTDDSDACFQGYGTHIHNNFYHHIQKCVILGNDCNGIIIENETVSRTCGSAADDGAPFYIDPILGHGTSGWVIRSGTIEMTNYRYCVTITANATGCTIDSVGGYDFLTYPTGFILMADGDTISNFYIVQSYVDSSYQSTYIDGPGKANGHTFITSQMQGISNFMSGIRADPFYGTNWTSVTSDIPAGTNMKIDSGSGGSHIDLVGFDIRFFKQDGTQQASINMGTAKGAITPGQGSTANRPSAVTAGDGAIWYDTTLKKLIASDGSSWNVVTPTNYVDLSTTQSVAGDKTFSGDISFSGLLNLLRNTPLVSFKTTQSGSQEFRLVGGFGSASSISLVDVTHGNAEILKIETSNNSIIIADGYNIPVGTTTGTKIGTGTTQKLGFFNATPVIQQTGDVATALQAEGLVASASYSIDGGSA